MHISFKSRDEMHADFMKMLSKSEELAVPFAKTSFAKLFTTLQKVSNSKIVTH